MSDSFSNTLQANKSSFLGFFELFLTKLILSQTVSSIYWSLLRTSRTTGSRSPSILPTPFAFLKTIIVGRAFMSILYRISSSTSRSILIKLMLVGQRSEVVSQTWTSSLEDMKNLTLIKWKLEKSLAISCNFSSMVTHAGDHFTVKSTTQTSFWIFQLKFINFCNCWYF